MAEAVEEVGLLLVHGMGEQRRQEHLKTTARELASYIAQSNDLIGLSIADVTEEPDGQVRAPIVIDAEYRGEGGPRRVRLHLHEAWWADLGIKGGFLEHVKFWFWGLGQWAAEVVRRENQGRNTARLMAMPRFPYQATDRERPGLLRQLPARATLWGAALLAILTFFTWSVAKRVVALLASRIPEPGLIFLFLGDVKIFERPGGPGKGTLLDPNMPVRATIRRRIVTAMTEVAAQPYDRWYMMAHSLGTVPAWNGLQELEVTLANYLTEEDWKKLPGRFKTVHPFTPAGDRYSTSAMMPRRPPWLADTDGVRRPVLFERFRGFISYGSPLDKFAALWPRIVCLNRQAEVFRQDAEWINLHDATDPVSARLDAFAAPLTRADDPSLPHGKGTRSGEHRLPEQQAIRLFAHSLFQPSPRQAVSCGLRHCRGDHDRRVAGCGRGAGADLRPRIRMAQLPRRDSNCGARADPARGGGGAPHRAREAVAGKHGGACGLGDRPRQRHPAPSAGGGRMGGRLGQRENRSDAGGACDSFRGGRAHPLGRPQPLQDPVPP